MSAIFGTWSTGAHDPTRDATRQAAALRQYGPDLDGQWTGGDVALGYRRAMLLDEDRFVSPIHAAGRRYAVVSDVHLSERDSLAEALGLVPGHDRLSDSALVAAALEAWNEAAFDRLYGSFAVAAWDILQHRLLLARDFIGARPLFFHQSANRFAFASMPDGLRALDDVPHGIDVDQYARFLRSRMPAFGRTHLAQIGRVMPGHFAVVAGGAVTQKRYWLPDLSRLELKHQTDYEARLRKRLNAAVASTLRGVHGCVASHLSAGFDSTAVTVFAARQMAMRGGKVVAFTAAPSAGATPEVPSYRIADESELAAQTAALHPNIEHVVVRRDRHPGQNLERTAAIYALPMPNLCNLTWTDAINDAARSRGLTVLLEAALGNGTISESGAIALPELLRAGRLISWAKVAFGFVRNGVMRPQGVIWNSVAELLPGPLWARIERLFGRTQDHRSRHSLLKPEHDQAVLEAIRAENETANPFDRVSLDQWDREGASSLEFRLELLTEDVGSHSKAMLAEWNIDTRDPTADRRLVEFALRVPVERLVWDGRPRAILRAVLAGLAPDEVINSRKKGMQFADWADAMAEARDSLTSELERIELSDEMAELIDVEHLKQLARDWPAPDSPFWRSAAAVSDYRTALLRAVSAAGHMRKASRSNL